ncbi:MAG TPA: sugar phosphate nucleotidyltransferase [Thermoleophilia bacterium]|nr:sugar phosphate nucleotidyltransferase [Thermoleophilia bacterium]
MKAVVMAGGQGTRLRPLTSNMPKPMVPVANKPTAQHILELLSRHGIRDVVMTVAFMPQLIQNFFGDGSSFGMQIDYCVEEVPLGTAGSVKNAQRFLDDTFLVISGDSLTDFDLTEIVDFHRARDAMVTIALKSVDNPLEFGVVIVDEHGRIERFLEKPGWGQVFSDTINTGIYVLEPEVLDHIPEGVSFDFSHQLFPHLYDSRKPLFGMLCEGYWQDIGSLAQFLQANRDALDGKVQANLPGVRLRGNVWVGHGADFDSLDNIQGPALIGDYARLSGSASIGAHTVLGNNVILRGGASVAGSVVGDGSYLGPGVRVRGAIVGSGVDIRANASIAEGAVLGEGSSVGEKAVVGSQVKVYPGKVIESGASVRSSLIWESRGQSSLFGKEGVRGLINIDITPELVMRLGMAYGTSLSAGSIVTTSRDQHPAARVLNRALTAGLNASGVTVRDLQIAPGSLTRFDLKVGNSAGGVHLRVCADNPEEAEIVLSERPGVPMSPQRERGMENIFYREDYRRVAPSEMGSIVFPARLIETYIGALLTACDIDRIRDRDLRVVLDHGGSGTTVLASSVLDALRLEVVSVNTRDPREDGADGATRPLVDRGERVGRLVRAMEADVGVLMDPGGESVTVLDETGAGVPDVSLLLLLLRHACTNYGPGNIVVPLHTTRRAEEVAAECGGNVVRTKVSESALLSEAGKPHSIFAGSGGGRFVLPAFLPAPDALVSFLMVLEMLASTMEHVSRLAGALPEVTVRHAVVECPWSVKGVVMRMLVERLKHQRVSLLDGVKLAVGSADWVQFLPDPGEPVFHVFAEADTLAASDELLARYAHMLQETIDDAGGRTD